MNEKEKIEVFGTWVFGHTIDKDGVLAGLDLGIMPYAFYSGCVTGAVDALREDYHIEKMGVITLVEDVFQI